MNLKHLLFQSKTVFILINITKCAIFILASLKITIIIYANGLLPDEAYTNCIFYALSLFCCCAEWNATFSHTSTSSPQFESLAGFCFFFFSLFIICILAVNWNLSNFCSQCYGCWVKSKRLEVTRIVDNCCGKVNMRTRYTPKTCQFVWSIFWSVAVNNGRRFRKYYSLFSIFNHFFVATDSKLVFLVFLAATTDLEKRISDAFLIFDHQAAKTVDVREIGTILRYLGGQTYDELNENTNPNRISFVY